MIDNRCNPFELKIGDLILSPFDDTNWIDIITEIDGPFLSTIRDKKYKFILKLVNRSIWVYSDKIIQKLI